MLKLPSWLRSSFVRFLPLSASSTTCLSDMSLYGCYFASVKISHMVTSNAHTSSVRIYINADSRLENYDFVTLEVFSQVRRHQ